MDWSFFKVFITGRFLPNKPHKPCIYAVLWETIKDVFLKDAEYFNHIISSNSGISCLSVSKTTFKSTFP